MRIPIEIVTDGDFKCDYCCPFLDEDEGKCLLFDKILIHPSRIDFNGFETCDSCRNVLKKVKK